MGATKISLRSVKMARLAIALAIAPAIVWFEGAILCISDGIPPDQLVLSLAPSQVYEGKTIFLLDERVSPLRHRVVLRQALAGDVAEYNASPRGSLSVATNGLQPDGAGNNLIGVADEGQSFTTESQSLQVFPDDPSLGRASIPRRRSSYLDGSWEKFDTVICDSLGWPWKSVRTMRGVQVSSNRYVVRDTALVTPVGRLPRQVLWRGFVWNCLCFWLVWPIGWSGFSALRRNRRMRRRTCVKCGYSLAGLVATECPECGHTVAQRIRSLHA